MQDCTSGGQVHLNSLSSADSTESTVCETAAAAAASPLLYFMVSPHLQGS